VVVRYDGVLQRPDGQVQTRRFESRIPAAADALAVAPALNEAANQVASEVADWVG
jgi:cholesterol transport system auxiliary component